MKLEQIELKSIHNDIRCILSEVQNFRQCRTTVRNSCRRTFKLTRKQKPVCLRQR